MSDPAAGSRIVVRAPGWLGDAILSLPAAAAIRRHFARAHLTIAAPASVAAIFREATDVAPDAVIELPQKTREAVSALKAGAFDIGILFPNSFGSAWQLRRATEFIEENCLRNIRLEELAAVTGLSQSHFSHAFKASTGVAPHQYQTNTRLERAKHLLLTSEYPLTTIAVETGFADQAHFTRVFRKHLGTTPANWKKAQLA